MLETMTTMPGLLVVILIIIPILAAIIMAISYAIKCKGCKDSPCIRRVAVTQGTAKGYLSHYKCNKCGKEEYYVAFSNGSHFPNQHWAEIFMDQHTNKGV